MFVSLLLLFVGCIFYFLCTFSHLHNAFLITSYCAILVYLLPPNLHSSPHYIPVYYSPFSGRQCDFEAESGIFVNVTNCMDRAFVRYPLWALQQILRRAFIGPKKVRKLTARGFGWAYLLGRAALTITSQIHVLYGVAHIRTVQCICVCSSFSPLGKSPAHHSPWTRSRSSLDDSL